MNNLKKSVYMVFSLITAITLIVSLIGILTTDSYSPGELVNQRVNAQETVSDNGTETPKVSLPPSPVSSNTTTPTGVPEPTNTTPSAEPTATPELTGTPGPEPSPGISPEPPSTPEITPPLVVTGEATNIVVFEFTLNGELTDLGDASAVQVFFEWWRIPEDIRTTDRKEMGGPGAFSIPVRDDMTVSSSTVYYYHAVAEVDGKTYPGDDKTFTTHSAVTTNNASDITAASAILHGTLADIDIPNEVAVSFDWGLDTNYGQTTDPPQNRSSGGSFQDQIAGLTPGTIYHYRAKVWLSGEKTDYGEDKTFQTLPESPVTTSPQPNTDPTATINPPPSAETNPPVAPLQVPSPTSPPANNPPASDPNTTQCVSSPPLATVGGLEITVINTNTFISDTSLEINVYNIVQNSVQLNSQDGKASLAIPRETRLQDASGKAPETLEIKTLTLDAANLPNKTIIQAYEFGPAGAIFEPPILLALNYDIQSFPSQAEEESLAIAVWDGSKWSILESRVDILLNTVSAKIAHFGQYALLAPVPAILIPASNTPALPSTSPPAKPTMPPTTTTATLSAIARAPSSSESPVAPSVTAPTPSTSSKRNQIIPVIWIVLGVVAVAGIAVLITAYRNKRPE